MLKSHSILKPDMHLLPAYFHHHHRHNVASERCVQDHNYAETHAT